MSGFETLALSLFIAASISLEQRSKAIKVETVTESELTTEANEPLVEEKIEEQRFPLYEDPIEREKEREEFDRKLKEVNDKFLEESRNYQSEERKELDELSNQLDLARMEILQQSDVLDNERDFLKNWEEQLKLQQKAINEWNPDKEPPKERIISLLEQNPQVLNDIIQVIESLRKRNTGLNSHSG
jgi:hypothetical protein